MKNYLWMYGLGLLISLQGANESFFEQPKRMKSKERPSKVRQDCAEEAVENLHLVTRNTKLNAELAELELMLIEDEVSGERECSFQKATPQELKEMRSHWVKRNEELREDNRKKQEDICLLKKMIATEKRN